MSKRKPDTYNRARVNIISRLLSFPTICSKDWVNDFYRKPVVGEFVSLQSAPSSKWQLSWIVEIDNDFGSEPRYLLESYEDHTLCWWYNVGFSIYVAENVNTESWKWSDRQYSFWDRFSKVCHDADGFMIRPSHPVFSDDYKVILSFFARHDFDNKFKFEKTFDDWRKVTKKIMLETYDEALKKHDKDKHHE